MKGRMEGDYILYDAGGEHNIPAKMHKSFAGTEEHHLSELLYWQKEWDRSLDLPTFSHSEVGIQWCLENHSIALEYEYGYTEAAITEKLNELKKERRSREDKEPDMDER